MRRRQLEPSQSFTADMLAKLNLSQPHRHVGGKDWDDQCCRPLLFSYRNSIPDSTGGHVASASAAFENQPLLIFRGSFLFKSEREGGNMEKGVGSRGPTLSSGTAGRGSVPRAFPLDNGRRGIGPGDEVRKCW